jgi:TnpA family transposase
MPRRVTLTDRQRDALLRLPVEQGELLRHYTLSDEDLGHIRQRRRAHNRFGFALQLCVLRYPGRVLAPGELIPAQVSDFIAAQLGLTSDDLLPMPRARRPGTNIWRTCAESTAIVRGC